MINNSKKIGKVGKSMVISNNLKIPAETPIYLSRSNEYHMKKKHKYEYDKHLNDIPQILENPDFVELNVKKSSLNYYKKIDKCNYYLKVSSRGTNVNHIQFARTMHIISNKKMLKLYESGNAKIVNENVNIKELRDKCQAHSKNKPI